MSERWKPKFHAEFWYWAPIKKRAVLEMWVDNWLHDSFYKAGNVHPTKEAAEAWGAAQGEAKE